MPILWLRKVQQLLRYKSNYPVKLRGLAQALSLLRLAGFAFWLLLGFYLSTPTNVNFVFANLISSALSATVASDKTVF